MPVGKLKHLNNSKYIDENKIIWLKRPFIKSLLHNPFKNYVFETYDENIISSSEALSDKVDFDNNIQVFSEASYNYYSSYLYPMSHLFADIIPYLLYKQY
jgi:hypothetical protein